MSFEHRRENALKIYEFKHRHFKTPPEGLGTMEGVSLFYLFGSIPETPCTL